MVGTHSPSGPGAQKGVPLGWNLRLGRSRVAPVSHLITSLVPWVRAYQGNRFRQELRLVQKFFRGQTIPSGFRILKTPIRCFGAINRFYLVLWRVEYILNVPMTQKRKSRAQESDLLQALFGLLVFAPFAPCWILKAHESTNWMFAAAGAPHGCQAFVYHTRAATRTINLEAAKPKPNKNYI